MPALDPSPSDMITAVAAAASVASCTVGRDAGAAGAGSAFFGRPAALGLSATASRSCSSGERDTAGTGSAATVIDTLPRSRASVSRKSSALSA